MYELPSGFKTVSLVCGAKELVGGAIKGTYIKSVTGNANIETITPTWKDRKIVFFGDSITNGIASTVPARDGYVKLLENELNSSCVVFGNGADRLYYYDESAISSFVSKIEAINTTDVYIAIGTNDYSSTSWTNIIDFQNRYQSLVESIHASLPDCKIYAQTPLSRSSETANENGITMAQFRVAITNACSGKAYVRLVDGTTLLTTANLADGVHPTTAGHAILANNIQAIVI